MEDITTLYLAISAWTILGICMYIGFVRMQLMERDTKFPQESKKTPEESFNGRGGWNGMRPVRKPFARLTLYADFFVAGFKTQRVALPYSAISTIELHDREGKDWLLINATDPETDKTYEMYFLHPETSSIVDLFKAKQ